jgi:hypothetical protein
LTVQYTAAARGKLSIFSDGDGRILVGESVITSVVYTWTGIFVNTTLKAIAGTLNNTYQDMYAHQPSVVAQVFFLGFFFCGRFSYVEMLNLVFSSISGLGEDSVNVAPFSSAYYSDEAAFALVEPILRAEEARLRTREISGVCDVGQFGIPVCTCLCRICEPSTMS